MTQDEMATLLDNLSVPEIPMCRIEIESNRP